MLAASERVGGLIETELMGKLDDMVNPAARTRAEEKNNENTGAGGRL